MVEIELERVKKDWGELCIKVNIDDAYVISEFDDDEIPVNADIEELRRQLTLKTLRPKTEADRRRILERRGYKPEHVEKIISELRRAGKI